MKRIATGDGEGVEEGNIGCRDAEDSQRQSIGGSIALISQDTHVPAVPLTLSATDAASFIGVSRSQWYKMDSAGETPMPIKVGGRMRWRRRELGAWVEAGCPSRAQWAQMSLDS